MLVLLSEQYFELGHRKRNKNWPFSNFVKLNRDENKKKLHPCVNVRGIYLIFLNFNLMNNFTSIKSAFDFYGKYGCKMLLSILLSNTYNCKDEKGVLHSEVLASHRY